MQQEISAGYKLKLFKFADCGLRFAVRGLRFSVGGLKFAKSWKMQPFWQKSLPYSSTPMDRRQNISFRDDVYGVYMTSEQTFAQS